MNNLEQISFDEAKNTGGVIVIMHSFKPVENGLPFRNYSAPKTVGFTPDVKGFMDANGMDRIAVIYCEEKDAESIASKL